jgi:hypothetical protein
VAKEKQPRSPEPERYADETPTDERPVPSQAEGDLETVEEDLREKLGNRKPGDQRQ